MQEAHSHNASIVLFFRPQKLGVLFLLHQSVFDATFHFNGTFVFLTQEKLRQKRSDDATFHFNGTFVFLTQEKRDSERFRCLKIDSRSSS